MKTASLDLEKSELPPAQARAILQVVESELNELTTKTDLQALAFANKADLLGVKADLQALRAELIGEIKGTIRWNFAFWIAQLGAMVAILKLLK